MKTIKTKTKFMAGYLLSKVLVNKTAVLKKDFTLPYWNEKISNNSFERLIRFYIAHKAMNSRNSTELEVLHKEFWKNQKSSGYYAEMEQRTEIYFFKYVRPYLEQLNRLVRDHQVEVVCEIGTGNGYLIDRLKSNLAGPKRFIGIDLSIDQIALNKKKFDGIEFIAGDAAAWIHQNITPRTLYVVNGGVFEYFSQASLVSLFELLSASRQGHLLAILMEALAPDYDLNYETESKPHGHEYSTSHNYPHLLKKSKFKIIVQDISNEPGYRALTLIAIADSIQDEA